MERRLKKEVSLFHAVGIFIGVILGSGILILPSIAANVAGAASLIAWVVMTLLAVPIALTFGYLASKFPSAGGISEFSKQAFGKKTVERITLDAEMITGFLFLSVVPIGPPIVLLTGASYLGSILGLDFSGVIALAILMLLAMLLINLRGIRFTGNFQTMITISIVILLLFVVLTAFHLVNPDNLKFELDIYPIGRAMTLIFWCYVGWEAVTHLSEEFKNPKRDFPLSILMALGVVGIMYLLVSFVVVGTHTYGDSLRGMTSLVEIANRSLGINGKLFVALIGFMTCFGSANVYVASPSRLLYALSRNGYLPEVFGVLNKKHAPQNALIAVAASMVLTLIAIYMFSISVETLLLLSNSIFITLYLIGSIAGIILLEKRAYPAISFVICFATLLFVGKSVVYPVLVAVLAITYLNLYANRKTRRFIR